MTAPRFIHLRVHTEYSLLEGAIKAAKVGKLAADAGMPAVGVADRANLFGALEFSQTAKDAGVQPLVACALPVLGIGGQVNARWAKTPTVVLLAQNETGWLNLCALSSSAYLDAGEMAEPGVAWDQVVARSGRIGRQGALRALGLEKQIGRIAAPVHRRAAELRQPHRLHPRNPGGRRRPARPRARVPSRPRHWRRPGREMSPARARRRSRPGSWRCCRAA